MNRITQNIFERVFEDENKEVREGWKEQFEQHKSDEEDYVEYILDYEEGYEDRTFNLERQCNCDDCDYCNGYNDAEEECECESEQELFDIGYEDCVEGGERQCDCGDCSYCNGWRKAEKDINLE